MLQENMKQTWKKLITVTLRVILFFSGMVIYLDLGSLAWHAYSPSNLWGNSDMERFSFAVFVNFPPAFLALRVAFLSNSIKKVVLGYGVVFLGVMLHFLVLASTAHNIYDQAWPLIASAEVFLFWWIFGWLRAKNLA